MVENKETSNPYSVVEKISKYDIVLCANKGYYKREIVGLCYKAWEEGYITGKSEKDVTSCDTTFCETPSLRQWCFEQALNTRESLMLTYGELIKRAEEIEKWVKGKNDNI